MLGMGLAVATFWATPAAQASGRPGIATSAVACGVLVNVALLVLVPGQGATGAAIALLGGYGAFTVTVSILLARTVLRDPARGGVLPPRHADAGPPGPS
jgi:O-antigen/teichoic acid export membrane protein